MRCGRVRVNTFLLPGCGRAPFRFLDQCLPPLECFRYSKSVGWRLLASWAASWPLYLRQSFVIVHVRGFDVTRFFSGARCLTEVGNSWILDIRGNFRVFLLTIWPSFYLRLDLLFSSRGWIDSLSLLNMLNLFLERDENAWIEFLVLIHWKWKNWERERGKNWEGTFYKNRDTSDKRIETYEIFEAFSAGISYSTKVVGRAARVRNRCSPSVFLRSSNRLTERWIFQENPPFRRDVDRGR